MLNYITNFDIMENDLSILFKDNIKANALYSDPPWGESNLKYWRTMNNQVGYEVNWMEFLYRLKYLYNRYVDGPLMLETGLRFEKDLIHVFGEPIKKYICVYGSKKNKNLLMIWKGSPFIDLTGKSGVTLVYDCLRSIFNDEQKRIIFDPCVGLGNTVKACKKLGWNVRANELNKERMLRTCDIMNFRKL